MHKSKADSINIISYFHRKIHSKINNTSIFSISSAFILYSLHLQNIMPLFYKPIEFKIFIIITQLTNHKQMSSFEDFIDKLGPYPNDVNRLARLIRTLDKRVQNLQASLTIQQKKFESKLKQLKQKKSTQIPTDLKSQYQSIIQKQKQLYGYSKQKQCVSDQLLSVITNSNQLIKTDLKNKIKDKPTEQCQKGQQKKKKQTIDSIIKILPKQQQFLYDNNPKYCYCNGGSYGEMVGCQNIYCQKQWFHSQCIDDKNYMNQDNWHCKDCKKLIQKFRKIGTVKEFVI